MTLQPFPDDWSRALVVVAHPDDMEYGGSGAVARWRDAGKEVAYLLVTRGEAGIDSLPPTEAGPLREGEQRAACAAVGVTEVDFLDHSDGVIEYGLPLRRDIAAVIRRRRPDLVVTGNFADRWPSGALNMADHVHTGRAVLDACRDAGNRWVFPGAGGEPWTGVRYLAVTGSPLPTHAVDIGPTFDRAVASLSAHRAYLAALGGDMADPETFLRSQATVVAEQLPGASLAVGFELFAL
ncbi:PIG-L deacetylase family protein [Pseudonocardia lutea]|jgi:LmbE family N-acetylglucosaminyl deacetylase|uniref:PIG-L deacetylase family protein n=1 Tax=Pseudonocardia lutea TaxID=2172015 RepID=A0ABW1IFY3_9PSEU